MKALKALIMTVLSALAVVVGAAPAAAAPQDARACDAQREHTGFGLSPSCRPAGQLPGTDIQHNETLVRDAA